MLDKIILNEISYISNFSKPLSKDNYIKFSDDNIPDMYTHNFCLIEKPFSEDWFKDFTDKSISERKKENADFLHLELNFPIKNSMIEGYYIEPEMDKCYYMIIETKEYSQLSGNQNCNVLKATNQKILNDGGAIDVIVNTPDCGEDFSIRRKERKHQIYKADNNVSFFVCYNNDIPVGMCELYINNDIAKIEEFDVLENHQRKGFGTAILKELLEVSHNNGAKYAYVVTSSDETAKEMYSKCGFKKIGEKVSLHYSF